MSDSDIITSVDKYIQKVNVEIERYKSAGKKDVFLMSVRVAKPSYAHEIMRYYRENGYDVTATEICGKCNPRVWDIILSWI